MALNINGDTRMMNGDDKNLGKDHTVIGSAPPTLALTSLQERILAIASDLTCKNLLINSERLHSHCIREIKDVTVLEINRAIRYLFQQAILIDGKAVTGVTVLENDNRRKIFELIKDSPGITEYKIWKSVNASLTTVKWHLKMLEDFQIVRIKIIKNKKIYLIK